MEQFIERSHALLRARPDTTRVTTKYTHKKVVSTGDRVSAAARPAKIVVKTYDPASGLVYKLKLKKMNELSRVLASLGPHAFDFDASRKRGAASLMADREFAEQAPEADAPEHEAKAEPAKAKKKKSRKH